MAYVPPHRRGRAGGRAGGRAAAAPPAAARRQQQQRTELLARQQRPQQMDDGHNTSKKDTSDGPRQNGIVTSPATSASATQHHHTTLSTDSIRYIECINLERRTDKWRQFIREVDGLQGEDDGTIRHKLHRFNAIDGDAAVAWTVAGTAREEGEEEEEGNEESTAEAADDNNNNNNNSNNVDMDMDMSQICREWDATNNAKYTTKAIPGPRTMTQGEIGCALSHIALWRKLVADADATVIDGGSESESRRRNPISKDAREAGPTMLILEDDAVFTREKRSGKTRFLDAFDAVWRQLPENDWGILYLGFSSRGERVYLDDKKGDDDDDAELVATTTTPPKQDARHQHRLRQPQLKVRLYKPEYGYHTHAYVITATAARVLLEHLPVRGPVDVWLADNQWFGLQVYCAVIAGEGWRRDDGTYEGVNLVSQNRGGSRGFTSDVAQSSEESSTRKPASPSSGKGVRNRGRERRPWG